MPLRKKIKICFFFFAKNDTAIRPKLKAHTLAQLLQQYQFLRGEKIASTVGTGFLEPKKKKKKLQKA